MAVVCDYSLNISSKSGKSPLNLEWNISPRCVKAAFAHPCIWEELLGGVGNFLTAPILNTTPIRYFKLKLHTAMCEGYKIPE